MLHRKHHRVKILLRNRHKYSQHEGTQHVITLLYFGPVLTKWFTINQEQVC